MTGRPAEAGGTGSGFDVRQDAELAELIGRLRASDVRLSVDGEELCFDAPAHAASDELLTRMRAHKRGLLRWLTEDADAARVVHSGPATYYQHRMYRRHAASTAPAGYNVAQRIPVRGPLDPQAMGRALTALTARQHALRSRLVRYGTELVQEVFPARRVPLPVTDVSALPAEDRARTAATWVREQAEQPFDLATHPYLRTALLRTGAEDWTFLLVVHHIVIDGWGLDVLLRDLAAFYAAALRSPAVPSDGDAGLAPLGTTYPQVGSWQRRHLSGDRLRLLQRYWSDALQDAHLDVEFPYDRPRPATRNDGSGLETVRVPADLADEVAALASDRGTTVFTVLLGVLGDLLCRLAGRSEVVVACNIANRVRREHEDLVGHFTNNVALRLRSGAGRAFGDLVDGTAGVFFAAAAHQDYPLPLLLEDRARAGSATTRFPQVLVVMQNQAAPELPLPGLRTEVHDVPLDGVKAELCFVLEPGADGIRLLVHHSAALFDGDTVRRWAHTYVELLRRAVAFPERPLDGAVEQPHGR